MGSVACQVSADLVEALVIQVHPASQVLVESLDFPGYQVIPVSLVCQATLALAGTPVSADRLVILDLQGSRASLAVQDTPDLVG